MAHLQYLNPIDYCNMFLSWRQVLDQSKLFSFQNDDLPVLSPDDTITDTTITISSKSPSPHPLPPTVPFTKFMAFSHIAFKGNHRAAASFIELNYLNAAPQYIRVGTDYFKIMLKKDRYGIARKSLKVWKKETITLDHGNAILNHIPRFDDFCIEPSNTHYKQIVDSFYNLYSEFTHTPSTNDVDVSDIPASITLIEHIFGEQLIMGLQYMKVLYERPRQALPVLSLLSSERQTGKTTFINWMNMIFGDNYILIHPEDLGKEFNSLYANKNIIAIDETVIERTAIGEKLKSLATAKTISVNQKHIANYMLPFFAKIILCTNKELDFMRIDDEEIRFWVRHVPHIKKKNTNIEEQLAHEIPSFLAFLQHGVEMPDFSHSRMVFTSEQLDNKWLRAVKEESRSTLYKEIYEKVEHWFLNHTSNDQLLVTAQDIKDEFFPRDNNISVSYIKKVLRDEFKLRSDGVKRYKPFDVSGLANVVGRPITFIRDRFVTEEIPSDTTAVGSKK